MINKYKEYTIKQIDYKNQFKLIDIINREKIKQLIKKLDNGYNNNLLPILKKYSSNSINRIYDFDSTITNDIKSTIEFKLNNIEKIFHSLKDFYQINITDWKALSFKIINDKISIQYNKIFKNFLYS